MMWGMAEGKCASALVAAFFAFLLLTAGGCASSEIEKAFSPGMEAEVSAKVIEKYCVSCHQHKGFSSSVHNGYLGQKYPSDFAKSSECRGCHTYEKNWLFDVRRGTHRPGGDG